jgi:hypothetical protein
MTAIDFLVAVCTGHAIIFVSLMVTLWLDRDKDCSGRL